MLLFLEGKIDKCALKSASQISQFLRMIGTYCLKPHSYSKPGFLEKPEMNDLASLDSFTLICL